MCTLYLGTNYRKVITYWQWFLVKNNKKKQTLSSDKECSVKSTKWVPYSNNNKSHKNKSVNSSQLIYWNCFVRMWLMNWQYNTALFQVINATNVDLVWEVVSHVLYFHDCSLLQTITCFFVLWSSTLSLVSSSHKIKIICKKKKNLLKEFIKSELELLFSYNIYSLISFILYVVSSAWTLKNYRQWWCCQDSQHNSKFI